MNARRPVLSALLHLCAPLPALILGVLTMRQLGVRAGAWSINLAAAAVGLLLFAAMRYSASPAKSRFAWHVLTIGSVTAILATFASEGLDGIHRWVWIGGFGLHASAVVAPVLIASVATAPRPRFAIATAVVAALLLALQPDAAQTTSFAAACTVILVRDPRFGMRGRVGGLVALLVCSTISLVRVDPLKPVRHVEGILAATVERGPACAIVATVALLLLPSPYFTTWVRSRRNLPLALGTYVALVTIAPIWGTFPVPIMGYGVSPILGYFIALALCARSGLPARSIEPGLSPSSA